MTKLHSPSGDRYIELNEPAARHHFEGLTHHIKLINTFDHFDIGRRSANPETQAQAATDSARIETYQFAVATLAGAILQLADMGLCMCSQNTTLPPSCVAIATDSKGRVNVKFAKYCVGRERHGLPLGAYIHAGRNPFAHWGDERELDPSAESPAGFHPFTQGVFDRLLTLHYNHPFADLVYNLGNRYYSATPIRAADIVWSVLQWQDYNTYEADMRAMIGSGKES